MSWSRTSRRRCCFPQRSERACWRRCTWSPATSTLSWRVTRWPGCALRCGFIGHVSWISVPSHEYRLVCLPPLLPELVAGALGDEKCPPAVLEALESGATCFAQLAVLPMGFSWPGTHGAHGDRTAGPGLADVDRGQKACSTGRRAALAPDLRRQCRAHMSG